MKTIGSDAAITFSCSSTLGNTCTTSIETTSIPKELWVGADAYFREFVQTKPGYARFWSEYAIAFDEPFRSYVTREFAKKPAAQAPAPTAAAP